MDTRRMTVWLGVIVFLVGIALLVYFDYRPQSPGEPATTVATEGPADDAAASGAENTAQAVADIEPVESGEQAVAAATDGPEGGQERPGAETVTDEQPAEPSDPAADQPDPADAAADSGERDAEVAEGAPVEGGSGADAAAEQMAENAPSEGPTLSEELDGEVAEVAPTEMPGMEEADPGTAAVEPDETADDEKVADTEVAGAGTPDAPPPAGEMAAEEPNAAAPDAEMAGPADGDAADEALAEAAPDAAAPADGTPGGHMAEAADGDAADEALADAEMAGPADGDAADEVLAEAAPDAVAPADGTPGDEIADAPDGDGADEEMAESVPAGESGAGEDVAAASLAASDEPANDGGEVETALVTPEDDPGAPTAVEPDEPAGESQPDDNGLSVELVPGDGDPSNDPDVVAPSFDIVRVEPTGDAVIAGLAEPGSTVELMSGSKAVATAEANERGEWAMALLDPLEPGAHELAIRTTSPDKSEVMISDERVAVMVPEAASEEPLVVLNTPEGPSTIAQVPEDVADATTPDTADGEPDAGTGAPDEPGETVVAAAPPEAAPAGKGAPAGEPVAEVPADESPAPGETEAETDVAMAPANQDVEDEAGTMVEEPAAGTAIDDPDAEPAGGDPASPAGEPEVAATEPEPEPEPEPVVPEVIVTAVEAETTGALFVAGTATTSENVRVYLDDELIGEAKPSPSGTWLIEVDRELPAGTYSVRADQIEAGAGTVVARAEVPFEREIEVAILKPLGESGGAAGAEASGTLGNPQTMIIKRRDNLWRISRRIYGKGIRWSTIYQANKDQIRNPRWIYPGQVFVLPEGNTAWEDDVKIDTSGLK